MTKISSLSSSKQFYLFGLLWVVMVACNATQVAPFEMPNLAVTGVHEAITGFQEKIQEAKKEFKQVHRQFVEDNFFCQVPHLQRIGEDGDDPLVNGRLLLELITFLDKDKSLGSQVLLQKCNDLFFLEFHKFICEADAKHSHPPCKMLQLMHDIYHHQVTFADGRAQQPFCSLVALVAIHVFMINASLAPYDTQLMYYSEKQACLSYALEKLRQAFVLRNKALGKDSINEQSIHEFINLLEIYGVKEPMVQAKVLRKWIIGLVLIGGTGLAIGYLINKYGWKNLKSKFKELVRDGAEVFGDGVVDAVQKRLEGRALGQVLRDVATPALDAVENRLDGFVARVGAQAQVVAGQTIAQAQAAVGQTIAQAGAQAQAVVADVDQRAQAAVVQTIAQAPQQLTGLLTQDGVREALRQAGRDAGTGFTAGSTVGAVGSAARTIRGWFPWGGGVPPPAPQG